MEVLSEQSAGMARRLHANRPSWRFATYEAFAMIVDSMTSQHAKWLKTCTPNCHGESQSPHSTTCSLRLAGATIITASAIKAPALSIPWSTKQGVISRIYLPPDANCLLSVADHCLRSKNYINLIVIDKQPHLQYGSISMTAREHVRVGCDDGTGQQQSRRQSRTSILACAGDVSTEETLAAAWLLRRDIPE